jgi:hypothetical protein
LIQSPIPGRKKDSSLRDFGFENCVSSADFRVFQQPAKAHGTDEGIEIVDDALIEAVELRSPLGFEPGICFDRTEKACRE